MSDAKTYRVPLRFRILRPFLKIIFRGIFRALARIKVTGQENIPFGKPYIAAMNHISIFDPPFAAAFWPEDLEIIGAKAYDVPRCVAIAAESRGHMQACLQACGAR